MSIDLVVVPRWEHCEKVGDRVNVAIADGRHNSRKAKVMRADYDSEGDTIQIELEPVRKLGHAEDVENGAVVVSIHEDRPVMVDVIGTRNGFEDPLRVAAETYELDAEALIAAARAALAAPNRAVTVDVAVRAAA